MRELKVVTNFKKLKSDLSTMTYKEKLEHLWTYYKWVLLVLLGVIMAMSLLITCIQNLRIEVIMGGVGVNVELSEAGEAYLKEDYKVHVGSESTRERVSFSSTILKDPNEAINDYMDNYYALQALLALCANHEVDYLITDRTGFEIVVKQDVCLDLTKVYTQEELDAMSDKVIYYQANEQAEKVPVAVNIADSAFIQENTDETDMVYFIYVGNSQHIEQTRALYDYLLAWKAEE